MIERRDLHRLLGVCTATLVLIGGCASPAPKDFRLVRPSDKSIESTLPGAPTPFERLSPGVDDLRRLQDLEQAYLSECAVEYSLSGLQFYGDYTKPPDTSRALWNGRFGTLTLRQAAEFGYHAPDAASAANGYGFYLADPLSIGFTGGSQDPDLVGWVVFGRLPTDRVKASELRKQDSPPGGCVGRLNSAVGNEPSTELLDRSIELRNLAHEDRRARAAFASWGECMKGKGHAYTAVDDPVSSFALTTLTEEETRIASDDVRCTQRSRWPAVYWGLVSAYEAQVVQHDGEALSARTNELRERLQGLERMRLQVDDPS